MHEPQLDLGLTAGEQAVPSPEASEDVRRTVPELDERSKQMLEVERLWWQYAGAKEARVRERFGITMTTYYQQINAMIDTEAALAYDPMLVKRLRKRRRTRQLSRSARHVDIDI